MEVVFKRFDQLTNSELYALLQLRSEVFVVEQDCVYQDIDDADLKAIHLLGTVDSELVACTRIIAPNIKYENHASIGRIVTAQSVRRLGYGKQIVQKSIDKICQLYGENTPIKISAQVYLNRFYNSLGFESQGQQYLEDGIPHVEMVK